MSLDGLTGKDLSFGPVKELYIANQTVINGGAEYFFETTAIDPNTGENVVASNEPLYSNIHWSWF